MDKVYAKEGFMAGKFVLLCFVFVFIATNVFALSETEWQKLNNSSFIFKQSEQELNKVWKEKYKPMPESPQKKALLEDQRNWLKSGRDAVAQAYIKQGMEYAQAYTQATFDRVGYLNVILGKENQKFASKPSAQQEQAVGGVPAVHPAQPMKPAQATQPQLQFSPNNVFVEAEGAGATKIEALKTAWTEAVNNAVKLYFPQSTLLSDNKNIEEIASFSSGQKNSYQILSEKLSNNRWHIRINARIDKDVIREMAGSTTSKTKDPAKSDDSASTINNQDVSGNRTEIISSE